MPVKKYAVWLLVFNSLAYAIQAQSPASSPANGPRQTSVDRTEAAECPNATAIGIILEEAISCGAPTYNDGNHIGCYRIYEGAAYKVLYKYGSKCKDVKKLLEGALELSYGDYSSTEKAWIMRKAFDEILGVPATTK